MDDENIVQLYLNRDETAGCFPLLQSSDTIMVCTYEAEGANPELLLYKKR